MDRDPFWEALEVKVGDKFRLEATSRDEIEGKALDRVVDPEAEKVVIPYRGPSERKYTLYTLTLDIGEQEAYHAYGPPENTQARGRVEAFDLLEDSPHNA
ncbi:hypothetical protein [Natrialba sp. SSL1]|uniref:hypothetical protein n=1 Tax=Natrialba sp. SSL1 TaxID=1869245 RepID=UPI0011146360|nr:hypothetical protein [Natrialba sp. SSL1]